MLLQPAEVLPGIEQAVGVVDAQAVDLALGAAAENQRVRGLEDVSRSMLRAASSLMSKKRR